MPYYLPPKELERTVKLYRQGYTLREIGELLGITGEAVLYRIKNHVENYHLIKNTEKRPVKRYIDYVMEYYKVDEKGARAIIKKSTQPIPHGKLFDKDW